MSENDETPVVRSIEKFYDLLAPNYDEMTGFEKRFAAERPFFQSLSERFHFRTALDAGCGSGFHAVLLSLLGVEVTGLDASAEMLRLAEMHAQERGMQLRTLQGSFENLGQVVNGRFASVFVMGNSLAHLLDAGALEKALTNFANVLDSRGLLTIQVLNYERILTTREHIQNEKRSGGKTFVRSYDYVEDGILFNILTREQKDISVEERVQAIKLRPVFRSELLEMLKRAGFGGIESYGSIHLDAFDPANSKDLVVLAVKQK